jgi:hypothetical protein
MRTIFLKYFLVFLAVMSLFAEPKEGHATCGVIKVVWNNGCSDYTCSYILCSDGSAASLGCTTPYSCA